MLFRALAAVVRRKWRAQGVWETVTGRGRNPISERAAWALRGPEKVAATGAPRPVWYYYGHCFPVSLRTRTERKTYERLLDVRARPVCSPVSSGPVTRQTLPRTCDVRAKPARAEKIRAPYCSTSRSIRILNNNNFNTKNVFEHKTYATDHTHTYGGKGFTLLFHSEIQEDYWICCFFFFFLK